ncbi:hypothetical protein BFS86_19360 [Shewanella algae]|nr:hypothetical protein BFS86_19360 [Shewanella algae]
MDVLTVIGSIASIIGALWAWKQAVDASGSATKAEEIKSQIINQRKTSELSEIRPLLEQSLTAMRRYSTRMAASIIGDEPTSKEDEAEKVQACLNKIMEYSEYFQDDFASQFYETAHDSLQKFLNSTVPEEVKKHGMDLHKQMVDFSSVLRKQINEKREGTV